MLTGFILFRSVSSGRLCGFGVKSSDYIEEEYLDYPLSELKNKKK
jgi:hypothetical protein